MDVTAHRVGALRLPPLVQGEKRQCGETGVEEEEVFHARLEGLRTGAVIRAQHAEELLADDDRDHGQGFQPGLELEVRIFRRSVV